MQQYNFPTTIYFGDDALESLAETLKEKNYGKILLVTDQTLTSLGMTKKICKALKPSGAEFIVFDEVNPNPQEDDVEAGVKIYKENDCEALIALGGGDPDLRRFLERLRLDRLEPLFFQRNLKYTVA